MDSDPAVKMSPATGARPGEAQREPLCHNGTIIRGKFRILQAIGMGAFGEIYAAENLQTHERVAVKVELADDKKQALRAEVTIMRRLQGCPCVAQFISCGRQGNMNFLVMELLGENLSDLRKRQPNGMFSMATVCRLAIEMINGLQAMHALGVLHRDVKPSNFVLGGQQRAEQKKDPSEANRLFIIDFGLSRKFVGNDGEIKPPRANAGFRGTARYASVNSHANKELSPRDDLWSVFYLLVEFATGSLPWRSIHDRDKVGLAKQMYLSNSKLTEGLPPEFEQFMTYLQTLEYFSKPDYGRITSMFRSLLARIVGLPGDIKEIPADRVPPYDWERARRLTGSTTESDDEHEDRKGRKRDKKKEGGLRFGRHTQHSDSHTGEAHGSDDDDTESTESSQDGQRPQTSTSGEKKREQGCCTIM